MALPLQGVRVLDFSQIWAGPLCGRILGELGAEVVKLEGLGRFDLLRAMTLAPSEPSDEFYSQSTWFLLGNAGKKDVTIDVSRPGGLELLRRFVYEGGWDVILEAFTPRVLSNWGIDYPALSQRLPDAILVSLPGFGHTGPWKDRRALGNGLEPASGVSSLTGYQGGPPQRSAHALSDPLVGSLAASYVVAALRARRRDGRGQHIVLAQLESAIPLVIGPLQDWILNRRVWERIGNRSRRYAPQGCYRCRGEDDWVVLSCRTEAEWQGLCRTIGRPALAGDPRFSSLEDRQRNHDELDRTIEAWTAQQEHRQAFRALQAAGVPAMAVLNGKEMLLDPDLRERAFWYRGEIRGFGDFPMRRQVVARFDRTSVRTPTRAPSLGEHNAELLGRIGLDDEDMKRLQADGVIGTKPDFAFPLEQMKAALKMPLEEMAGFGQVLRIERDFRTVLEGLPEAPAR